MFFKPKFKTLGEAGEYYARAHYKGLGFSILGVNFFNRFGKRFGEIDFIATNRKTIVFVEVKTRAVKMGKFGTALESVNQSKQYKLLKTSKLFLLKNPQYFKLIPRIDVCAVELSSVDEKPKSVIIYSNAVQDTSS